MDKNVDVVWLAHGYVLSSIEEMPGEYQVEMDMFSVHPGSVILKLVIFKKKDSNPLATSHGVTIETQRILFTIAHPECARDVMRHNTTHGCGCLQRWDDWDTWRQV